jgi:hypothetical protein
MGCLLPVGNIKFVRKRIILLYDALLSFNALNILFHLEEAGEICPE